MTRLLSCVGIAFAIITMPAITIPAICWADDEREIQPRSKGTELYSWKDEGGEWVFALLYGTNWIKPEAYVKNTADQIRSVEDLNIAFARLSLGESVIWIHRVSGFEYPPEAAIERIKELARKAEISLHVERREKERPAEPGATPDRGGS